MKKDIKLYDCFFDLFCKENSTEITELDPIYGSAPSPKDTYKNMTFILKEKEVRDLLQQLRANKEKLNKTVDGDDVENGLWHKLPETWHASQRLLEQKEQDLYKMKPEDIKEERDQLVAKITELNIGEGGQVEKQRDIDDKEEILNQKASQAKITNPKDIEKKYPTEVKKIVDLRLQLSGIQNTIIEYESKLSSLSLLSDIGAKIAGTVAGEGRDLDNIYDKLRKDNLLLKSENEKLKEKNCQGGGSKTIKRRLNRRNNKTKRRR